MLITVHLSCNDTRKRAEEKALLVNVGQQALKVDPDVIVCGDSNTTEKDEDTIAGLANSLGFEILMPHNPAGTTHNGSNCGYILVSPDLYNDKATEASLLNS